MHREVPVGSVFSDQSAEIICETNAPGCAERYLFASDEPIVDPAVNGLGVTPSSLAI